MAMRTYWVLEYSKGSRPIFVKSESETAETAKFALKFESQGLAQEFLDERPRLFMFQPVSCEFDFDEGVTKP